MAREIVLQITEWDFKNDLHFSSWIYEAHKEYLVHSKGRYSEVYSCFRSSFNIFSLLDWQNFPLTLRVAIINTFSSDTFFTKYLSGIRTSAHIWVSPTEWWSPTLPQFLEICVFSTRLRRTISSPLVCESWRAKAPWGSLFGRAFKPPSGLLASGTRKERERESEAVSAPPHSWFSKKERLLSQAFPIKDQVTKAIFLRTALSHWRERSQKHSLSEETDKAT